MVMLLFLFFRWDDPHWSLVAVNLVISLGYFALGVCGGASFTLIELASRMDAARNLWDGCETCVYSLAANEFHGVTAAHGWPAEGSGLQTAPVWPQGV